MRSYDSNHDENLSQAVQDRLRRVHQNTSEPGPECSLHYLTQTLMPFQECSVHRPQGIFRSSQLAHVTVLLTVLANIRSLASVILSGLW